MQDIKFIFSLFKKTYLGHDFLFLDLLLHLVAGSSWRLTSSWARMDSVTGAGRSSAWTNQGSVSRWYGPMRGQYHLDRGEAAAGPGAGVTLEPGVLAVAVLGIVLDTHK